MEEQTGRGPDLLRCSRCKQLRPTDGFNWRRKLAGQRDSYCRPCRAEYKQEHYAANRERYVSNAAKWQRDSRKKRLAYVLRFFKTHPCVDCGETDPRLLEFDHVADKSFNVSYGIRYLAWDRVLAEIAKCEVRCGNCHRRKTAQRQHFYRARLLQSQPAPGNASSVFQAGGGN
jgi:hypothetical protein